MISANFEVFTGARTAIPPHVAPVNCKPLIEVFTGATCLTHSLWYTPPAEHALSIIRSAMEWSTYCEMRYSTMDVLGTGGARLRELVSSIVFDGTAKRRRDGCSATPANDLDASTVVLVVN